MWVIEKKNILTIVLVAVLLVAGYLNIRNNRLAAQEAAATDKGIQGEETDSLPEDGETGEDAMQADHVQFVSGAPADFFADFKVKREQTRREEIEYVRTILNQENIDEVSITQAQDKIDEITAGMERELTVEGLLEAKGFSPVAAVFHPGSANIIVGTEELSEEQVTQIADIVVRETGIDMADINIMPYFGQ